jgi:hypothetical protein
MECDTPLERSQWELQLCLRPHPNWRSEKEGMAPQSCGGPILTILGFPFGSLGTKRPFGCGPPGEAQRILYGGRWWLLPSPGHGESCESCESKVARGLS